jgi:hypothetical protein
VGLTVRAEHYENRAASGRLLLLLATDERARSRSGPAGTGLQGARRAVMAKDMVAIHGPRSRPIYRPRTKPRAVVICPGGGHRLLVYNAEGVDPAAPDSIGAAFVRKYRLGASRGRPTRSRSTPPTASAPCDWCRGAAEELDPARGHHGLLGQSRLDGGLQPRSGDPTATDPIDRLSRPARFQIMIIPARWAFPTDPCRRARVSVVANDDRGAARLPDSFRVSRRKGSLKPMSCRGGWLQHGLSHAASDTEEMARAATDWMTDNGILDP